jgi:biopolymer transport protein ExbD
MKIRRATSEEKIELQMTPMIDIIFQLLVFFIMSFKIILPEGDFNIRMPLAAMSRSSVPSETPTLRLRLRADADGNLAGVFLGEQALGNAPGVFGQVHAQIRSLVGDAGGPGTASDQEVEIEADYNLKYANTIRAITAISGYIENGQRHQLIEKVRFAPPRQE